MRIAMVLFLSLGVDLTAFQKEGKAPSISLDDSRPYVEILFERSGPRLPVFDGEEKRGLWLKLRNNCILPINVQVLPGSGGNPGLLMVHDVIGEQGEQKPLSPSRFHPLLAKPSGYTGPDVVNSREIAPGKDLLFSVPASHVTREWFLRVEVHLITPVPTHGSQPRTFVEFDWSQLPADVRLEADQELYGRVVR